MFFLILYLLRCIFIILLWRLSFQKNIFRKTKSLLHWGHKEVDIFIVAESPLTFSPYYIYHFPKYSLKDVSLSRCKDKHPWQVFLEIRSYNTEEICQHVVIMEKISTICRRFWSFQLINQIKNLSHYTIQLISFPLFSSINCLLHQFIQSLLRLSNC